MGTTSQVGKKKKMSVHAIDTVASMKKLKEKIAKEKVLSEEINEKLNATISKFIDKLLD